jgi:(p)ppGpp synthase/HD superfamily hydrolase
MANLEEAIGIAVQAHRGQTDKAGAPYILHPLRMMFAVQTDAERMAAVLHDVVEDTDWTLDALRERGFPEHVVTAVDHLTRREGESYEAFVLRAAAHPVARRVKVADLEDNMDVRRTGTVSADDLERLAKYHRAWRLLTGDLPE